MDIVLKSLARAFWLVYQNIYVIFTLWEYCKINDLRKKGRELSSIILSLNFVMEDFMKESQVIIKSKKLIVLSKNIYWSAVTII